jgi:hypothetical protein
MDNTNTVQAKSFLSGLRVHARQFYATSMRGEVSDANIRGYLRAASQIEDIWQQIDNKVAALLSEGKTPWDAYGQMRYALAFIRAARAYQVFVRELLAADAAFDPETEGYLPQVTYDQANALCHQIQPTLEHAIAALNNPNYIPDVPVPFQLGPRIEAEGAPCPIQHLQGMISAAREIREWAAGLLAQYSNAVSAATVPVPQAITAHINELQGLLNQADSELRFGTDLVGQVTQSGTTPELHEQAENNLWDGMQHFFLINQIVAIPGAFRQRPINIPPQGQPVPSMPRTVYRDRPIRPDDLWRVAAPSARTELRGTEFGTDEMNEMCEKMGGILSAGAQQYLDEVEAAEARGDVQIIAAMANCPFEPLYKALRPLDIAGANVPAGYEFHWNFHRGHMEMAPRFGRTNDWQECQE